MNTKRIDSVSFEKQVSISRYVYLIVFVLVVLFHTEINHFLDIFWQKYLLESSLFNYESFEPLMATFTFALVMACWVVIDFYLPYFHQYRISNSDDISTWKGRESALYNETLWYILPWLIIDIFIKRRKLPSTSPTIGQIFLEIFLALWLYDLLFFIGHVCFHKSSYLFKHIHSKHHHSKIIRATDTIRHTFWDGTFDVLCSVLALNLTKAHPLSRSLYNIVAIILITEAHCGMNFPWMLHNVLPKYLMAGPVVHDAHHRYGNVNFQKYFTYLDYLVGTYYDPSHSHPVTAKVK